MKFPTYEEMAQNVAERALDEIEFNGKTIREWTEIILANASEDTISRRAAIKEMFEHFGANSIEDIPLQQYWNPAHVIRVLEELLPVQPEIVNCKDCRKHNKKLGFDENYNLTYKDDACPLIPWRGMSKGHEHDYQFCCSGERREVTK